MKVRPAGGGRTIDEAMALAHDVDSWDTLLKTVKVGFYFWDPTPDNVTIEWYCYDERIGWDTHLVCVDGKAALFTDGILPDTPVCNILPS